MFFAKIRPEVKALVGDMRLHPEDWKRGEYWMKNKRTEMSIYISGGADYIKFENGRKEDFTSAERKLIFKTVIESSCLKAIKRDPEVADVERIERT